MWTCEFNSVEIPLPVLLYTCSVVVPGTPEKAGVLNKFTVESSSRCTPSPTLLNELTSEAASRSRPERENREMPINMFPDATIFPPKTNRCAPETTVKPVVKLFTAFTVHAGSAMNILELREIWIPRTFRVAVMVAEFRVALDDAPRLSPNTPLP